MKCKYCELLLFVVCQYSWISLIVSNHEIKNSTNICHHIHFVYIMCPDSNKMIHEIKNSTNICHHIHFVYIICPDYNRLSTNLRIHINTFIFPETTKIDIHEFKCIHSTLFLVAHLCYLVWVSDCCWTLFQLYDGENKLYIDEMMSA